MKSLFLIPCRSDGVAAWSGDALGASSWNTCYINDTQCLLVVDHFATLDAEEWLYAQPGVVEFSPWHMNEAAQPALLDALTTSAADSLAQIGDPKGVLTTPPTLRDVIRSVSRGFRFD